MIHRLSRMIVQWNNKNLAQYGLTTQQATIIGYLYFNRHKYVNQKAVEQEIGVKGSSVTSIIRNLEKQGLINRDRDTNDIRNKIIRLSEKGIQLRKVLFKQIVSMEKRLLKDVSPEERVMFLGS